MDRPEVLVLGAINQDEVVHVSQRPAPGETVITNSAEIFQGGKGANQAYAAAMSGLQVAVKLVSAVGDDAAGRNALASLRDAGVECSLVRTVVQVPTGRAYIAVSDDGENSIIVALGANAFVTPSALPSLITADVVVAQSEVGAASVAALARIATAAGSRLILNNGPALELDALTLAAADPLIVNEHEAADMIGGAESDPIELAALLRSVSAARSVLVTLGAQGSVIADAAGIRHHDSVKAEAVIDTTGAGDTFIGTFAACVAVGEDNDTAIIRGAHAAAEAVTWRGARRHIPRHTSSETASFTGRRA